MKKIFKIKLHFVRLLISLIFVPSLVFPVGAATALAQTQEVQVTDPKTVDLVNPIGGHDIEGQKAGITDLTVIVGGIIKKAMGILGSLALLVFVYGGFMWVIAAGNAENVKKGTDAMQWAVIGICIIFSSYAIIDLVLQGIGAGVSKTASYEKKPGQVWCRDDAKQLCLATKQTECSGQTFETLAECEGDNAAYEGGWCSVLDGDKKNVWICVERLKKDCTGVFFSKSLDMCKMKIQALAMDPPT